MICPAQNPPVHHPGVGCRSRTAPDSNRTRLDQLMKRLEEIPMDELEQHDQAGTLGDSDEITEHDLGKFDRQLKPFGLELTVFENGSALNWFISRL